MTAHDGTPTGAAGADRFDLVVLGAGSAGEYAAAELAGRGWTVAAVELLRVGGECPYLSCMPSKALLHEARARRSGARPGPDAAAWRRAVVHRDAVTEQRQDDGAAGRLQEAGVQLVRGRGRIAAPGELQVDLAGGGQRRLHYTHLLISTGSRPAWPPVDGLAEVPTWTSDQALASDVLPDRLIVLGGGPVGCELASVYRAFGTQVVLVEAAGRLVPAEDPALGEALAAVLRGQGVDLRLGVSARRARHAGPGARLLLADGAELEADRVLVATGRRPAVDGIGLEALGVRPDPHGLAVDARCRVRGAPGVLAAGDVTGRAPYTHTANYHGRLVVDELTGAGHDADERAIPRVVYTDPPLAAVGLTCAAAERAGVDLVSVTLDVGDTARALAERDGGPGPAAGGVLVLHADRRDGRLVGAGAVATGADSWIGEAQLAIRAQVPLAVLADLVHPFPGWSEIYTPGYAALAARAGGG